MRVTSTCVLFACIFDTANTQFSDSDADDLDYASMLAMPSADVLAQLIALSQMNAASSGNKKKKNKNKKIQVHPIQRFYFRGPHWDLPVLRILPVLVLYDRF